jgi:hypothetical protein
LSLSHRGSLYYYQDTGGGDVAQGVLHGRFARSTPAKPEALALGVGQMVVLPENFSTAQKRSIDRLSGHSYPSSSKCSIVQRLAKT